MALLKLMKGILLASSSASVFTLVFFSTAPSLAQNNKTEMRKSVLNRLTIAPGKQVSTIGKYRSSDEYRSRLVETFRYVQNSRLMATENRTEPPGHNIIWNPPSIAELEKAILSDLTQARNEIAQSPSLQSCRAWGHMKNGMLTLFKGKTEPMAGHVNWCKIKLYEGKWDQVVNEMEIEFVEPIQKVLQSQNY